MSAKKMIARRIDRAVERANRRAKRDAIKKVQADRGRARRFLAQQMGVFMLNELEHVGCFSIKDYANIRPKSVINAWVNEFGIRRIEARRK